MKLDIINKEIVIKSDDIETNKLYFLKPLFNKKLYKSDNYHKEIYRNVYIELYDNNYIKFNLYDNKLNNNVKQSLNKGLESIQKVISKINNIDEITNIDEIDEIDEISNIDETDEIDEIDEIDNFTIINKYYLDITVEYIGNSILYHIDLKDMDEIDYIHLFNLLESNNLYHYVNIYRYKGNKKYCNLKFNSHEIVKFYDYDNFKFNNFLLLLFVDNNKKEINRLFDFIKYSIIQLHKLRFDYIELNKLYVILSRYIYKNNLYDLFLFIREFYYFKVKAYNNNDYTNKLKRLVLKDKRFNLNLSNKDDELGYLNICFHEKHYSERLSIGETNEYKEEMRERRKESSYIKGFKRNCHGFDKVLGDIRSTELYYNDDFYKSHEIQNENRRTHWVSFYFNRKGDKMILEILKRIKEYEILEELEECPEGSVKDYLRKIKND